MIAMKRRRTKRAVSVQKRTENRITLLDLPPEILEIIIKFFSYSEMQSCLRLVCKRLCEHCRYVTQRKFVKTEQQIQRELARVNESISNRAGRKKHFVYIYLLETLEFLYRLLRAVTWRYTYRTVTPHYFYGGLILDDVDYFLCVVRRVLYPTHAQVLDDLVLFHKRCKTFCSHFEQTVESKVNVDCTVSGAKLVDILDCVAHSAHRTVHLDETTSDLSRSKYIAEYSFPLAWFLSLPTARSDRHRRSWAQTQRYMYLRMRRLVFNHGCQLIEGRFVARMAEFLYRRPQSAQMHGVPHYCGFGQTFDTFVYYGCVSRRYYERHCRRDAETTPELMVTATAYMSAPIALASYYQQSRWADPPSPDLRTAVDGPFWLRVVVHCEGAKQNHLPATFQWSVASHDTPEAERK